MSLINDALRKAQSQRAQSPGLGDDSGVGTQPLNYADRPNRFGLMIGLGMGIILLLGLVAWLTVLLLDKEKSQAAEQNAATGPGASVSEMPPQASMGTPTKPAHTAPKPAGPTPTVAPAPVAEPNQEIVDWLDQSRVTGVRITSTSSKVILNNEAFIPGDSVNMKLGLKVLEIEAERIIFIDSNGVKYIKML